MERYRCLGCHEEKFMVEVDELFNNGSSRYEVRGYTREPVTGKFKEEMRIPAKTEHQMRLYFQGMIKIMRGHVEPE